MSTNLPASIVETEAKRRERDDTEYRARLDAEKARDLALIEDALGFLFSGAKALTSDEVFALIGIPCDSTPEEALATGAVLVTDQSSDGEKHSGRMHFDLADNRFQRFVVRIYRGVLDGIWLTDSRARITDIPLHVDGWRDDVCKALVETREAIDAIEASEAARLATPDDESEDF
jgi:hypothetical protein